MSEQYYDENVCLKLEKKELVNRVSELVRSRLLECGWRDQIALACRKYCDEGGSVNSLEELVAGITPKARSMVPDAVKRELLHELELILKAVKIPGT